MPRPANPELVERIVTVTARMIDEHGIDHVTIRRISRESQCSPTVIYHYFDSKDGLLHRAVQQGFEWFGAFVQTHEQGLSGLDRLRGVARAYVQWGVSNPSMYRLMFEQRMPHPATEAELRQRRSGFALAHEMLRQVIGETSEVDTEVAANVFFISLHGIVSTTISGRLWGPGLEQANQLELSVPLTDALVDQWAHLWNLE